MTRAEILAAGAVRRAAVLQFIRDYYAEYQYSPTRKEIREAVGLASPNSLQPILERLERDGYIRIGTRPRIARSIVLLDPGDGMDEKVDVTLHASCPCHDHPDDRGPEQPD